MAIPSLFCFTASAVNRVLDAVGGLQVDPIRMRANLDLTGGLIMAESLTMVLASRVGRPEAQRIVKALCERAVSSGVHLHQVALEEEHVKTLLSPEGIDRALDPGEYLGSVDAFIKRALASYLEVQSSLGGR